MVYNQIFRFSFQRSCVLFAALHLSFSLYSQQILPDTIALKTVVIQSTRASDNHPAPHSNFSAEKIAQSYQAQDIPMLLSSVASLAENEYAGAVVC